MSVDAQLPPGDGRPLGLGPHLESFVNGLRVAGYASRTVRSKRCAAARFLKWLQEEQISVFDADKSHVAAFIERGPRRSKHRYALERAAARGLVEHVRDGGAAPRSLADLTSASTALEKDYADYLRNERGLSAGSVRAYLPVVTDLARLCRTSFYDTPDRLRRPGGWGSAPCPRGFSLSGLPDRGRSTRVPVVFPHLLGG